MAVSKPKLSETEVFQKIDLSELLDRDPTPGEAASFIEQATEFMIFRSQSGSDVNGKSFKQYSENYADFKGVSRSDVDMTLFGDMLSSIDGFQENENVVLSIGGEQAVKAYAHMTGFKGHPTIKNGPKREFFGLTEKDAKEIADAIKEDIEEPSEDASGFAPPSFTVDEILSLIGVEIG